jgi:endogenous inhibitor of DNA gyrase (YacG/DUF329 family)
MPIPANSITCPTCGKAKTWQADNAFRPFCSERCKLVDLGGWADASHRIPGPPVDPDSLDQAPAAEDDQNDA